MIWIVLKWAADHPEVTAVALTGILSASRRFRVFVSRPFIGLKTEMVGLRKDVQVSSWMSLEALKAGAFTATAQERLLDCEESVGTMLKINADGSLKYAHKALLKSIGWDRQSISGQNFQRIFNNGDRKLYLEAVAQAIANKTDIDVHLHVRFADQRIVIMRLTGEPVLREATGPSGEIQSPGLVCNLEVVPTWDGSHNWDGTGTPRP